MSETTNYGFPLIAEGQSQKFQTHNDAIAQIDEQLAAIADGGAVAVADLTDGPGAPAGNGGKAVRANSGSTALEYYTPQIGAVLSAPGGPYTNGEELAAVTLPFALRCSGAGYASHATAPAAACSISIRLAGVEFATAVWNGTAWSVTGAQTDGAAGVRLAAVGPGTADAALTGFAVTLLAERI